MVPHPICFTDPWVYSNPNENIIHKPGQLFTYIMHTSPFASEPIWTPGGKGKWDGPAREPFGTFSSFWQQHVYVLRSSVQCTFIHKWEKVNLITSSSAHRVLRAHFTVESTLTRTHTYFVFHSHRPICMRAKLMWLFQINWVVNLISCPLSRQLVYWRNCCCCCRLPTDCSNAHVTLTLRWCGLKERGSGGGSVSGLPGIVTI